MEVQLSMQFDLVVDLSQNLTTDVIYDVIGGGVKSVVY